MVYFNRRMHSLGKKVNRRKTTKEVLEESITALWGDYPDFNFEYNEQFFNEPTQRE